MVFQSALMSSKHLLRTLSSPKGSVKGFHAPTGSGIVARHGHAVAAVALTGTSARSFASAAEDPKFESILVANKAWREKKLSEDPTFFKELGKEHKPDFLYIGCSDARLAVADLTGIKMGKLFVHRNIANMVVSSDLNLLSVLTYAIDHLHVKHILVTGHYDCGGIRASMKKLDFGGVLDAWLQNIRDVSRLHKDELDAIQDDEERHRRLVELNVMEQCLNLYKTSVVQKKRLDTHADKSQPFAYPRIHGLVFDPSTGILKKIDINYREKIAELHDLYDLFELEENDTHFMLKK
jgi:carbonic anhydrase